MLVLLLVLVSEHESSPWKLRLCEQTYSAGRSNGGLRSGV